MKSRLSYFLISGIIILSLLTGVFIWRNKHLKELPTFNKKSFTAPISSKYIPTNADLAFHWKINPSILPNYIESYQDKINKTISNVKTNLIIDSSFKLISLDFTKDVAKWSGDYGSFAVFNSNKTQINDWLMVIGIKNGVNIEEELDSMLDTSSINENAGYNNNSIKSKLKIISKKINSNKSIYFAIEKDNVLIASNPETIELSISQLDSNTLNTKVNYKNIQLKDNLNDGILLLEMSPKKIFDLIGQKKNLLELNEVTNLISSINLDTNKLNLEGILSYDIRNKIPIKDPNYNLIEIQKEFESFDNFILVNNPKQYFKNILIHPYKKFIASIIKESTTSDYSNLFKIILENSKGDLIWLKDKGWLVLTKKSDTNKKEISDILKKDKFLNSKLEFQKKDLEVWSKISTNKDEKDEIEENIEAIMKEDKGTYLWSKSLSSISSFDNSKYLENHLYSENRIDEFNDFDDILRIHLGKEKTETFLSNFYPYILFKTMLGNQLNFPQNIDISIGVPTINYPDFIKFKINLKTS